MRSICHVIIMLKFQFQITWPSSGVYGCDGAVGMITLMCGNFHSLPTKNRIHSKRLFPVSPTERSKQT